MSVEAMTWALKQNIGKSSAKLVLVMLAEHAEELTGVCIPRIKVLADECDMDESTAKRCISYLEEKGFIRIEKRYAGGSQLPNQYWVMCPSLKHQYKSEEN